MFVGNLGGKLHGILLEIMENSRVKALEMQGKMEYVTRNREKYSLRIGGVNN